MQLALAVSLALAFTLRPDAAQGQDLDATVSANRGAGPDLEARTRAGVDAVFAAKGWAQERRIRRTAALRFADGEKAHRLLSLLADLRGRRAILTRRGPGDTPSALFEKRRAFLANQIAWLERYWTYKNRRRQTAAPPVATLETVQPAIPPDAALVELVGYSPPDGPPAYAAYIVSHEGPPRFVDLGPAAPIDAAAAALGAAARDPASTDVRARSKALAARLLDPLWPHLRSTARWIVAPDGPLHVLPFELLTTPDGRWLDESHGVSYLHAGRALATLDARVEAGEPPLIVADPAFDPPGAGAAARIDLSRLRFPRLPGAAAEARAIAAALPEARVLRGADATEAALKRSRGPTVLHLATHGFFLDPRAASGPNSAGPNSAGPSSEGPDSAGRGVSLAGDLPAAPGLDPETAAMLDAGLALAGVNRQTPAGDDGVLTALEAAALDLRGTALVVLSACETGLGRPTLGAGLAGFRRALAIAGAESQLLTLWKVDDDATRALMTAFYRRLAAGEGRLDALRAARAELRGEKARAHPFFWAAFTLAGDWRPVTTFRAP